MAEEHNALKYAPQISHAGAIAAGGAYGDVGISRLGESLLPTINLWELREWDLLRGEIGFARDVISAAVAARFSSIELVNPAGRSKLAVVRFLFPGNSTPFYVAVENGGSIAANPVTNGGVPVDGRYSSIGEVSQCTIVTGDVAATIALPQWRFSVTAGAGPVTFQPQWIVPPGRKLFCIATGVNSAIECGFYFTERTPFPGELQARG